MLRAGDADLILAGGIESMSNAPFLSRTMRSGNKFGHNEMVDEMLYDGLTNVYTKELMGELAEYTAGKAGLTREMQDEWALRSQQRTAAADQAGRFKEEIVPIELPRRKGTFSADETYRADTTAESLAGLRPAFSKDGTVTAGNASQLSDGAGMYPEARGGSEASDVGTKPITPQIVDQATAGGRRRLFFTPPVAFRWS